MRPTVAFNVSAWLERHNIEDLFLSAMTVAELRFGAERLMPGPRSRGLTASIDAIEGQAFKGRILPFNVEATKIFGRLKAARERRGRPIEDADAVIAATALVNGFALATRNTRDFEDLGLTLINPFEPIA